MKDWINMYETKNLRKSFEVLRKGQKLTHEMEKISRILKLYQKRVGLQAFLDKIHHKENNRNFKEFLESN